MPAFSLNQTAFTAGELSPRVLGRTDMDRYGFGLKRCRNATPVIHGGAKRRPGTLHTHAAYVNTALGSILVPFVQGRSQAWILEFGELKVRMFNAAGTSAAVELVTPYPASSLGLLDWAQSDSTLWLFHPDYPTQRLQRLGTSTWVISPAAFTQQPFSEIGFVASTTGTLSAATVGAGRTLTASGATFLASDVGRGVIFDAGLAVITGYTSTTVVTVEITRAFPSVTLVANQWTVDISPQTTCTPSAKDPVGAAITLTLGAAGWRATDVGAIVRINSGLCRITGYTSGTVVDAVILRELSAIVAAPALAWSLEPSVWGPVYGYPRTGTIYQQRLILAGNRKFPRTVWGSRTGEPLDFERWTDDNDSFAFTIDSDEATAITFISAIQELAVFTESGEYSMRGGVEKPITPSNVRIKLESTHGCAQVRPVQINREAIFVQRSGRKVRAFGYRYDFDGFTAPDISALAEHVTAGGVTWLCYAQEAEQQLWAVRADGALLSCTIDRDQQPSVIAWAPHDTTGAYECLAAIPNGDREQVWAIVRRVINGSTVRYIERMDDTYAPRADAPTVIYGTTVDCGLVFDTPAGEDTFAVPHLVGQAVDIVADGSKMPRMTVPGSGNVTIPRASKRTLIGLPFTTHITLLTPEVQGQSGSAQGKPMRAGRVFIKFLETLAAKVQNNTQPVEQVAARQFGPGILDAPPELFTGTVEMSKLGWERGVSEVSIIQDEPFPMHVLSVVRETSITG